MPQRVLSIGDFPPVQNGTFDRYISSADFLDEMIALVQDGVSMFDHTCLSYTPHAHGITLHFINQPDAEADVVIASDGIKSRLRAHLYGHKGLIVEEQTARYTEWVAWRGHINSEVPYMRTDLSTRSHSRVGISSHHGQLQPQADTAGFGPSHRSFSREKWHSYKYRRRFFFLSA
jgi:2-polyprenyl-6-methoxyphenol hydroxylase-like FAD-dependent oxidoreductase